MVHACLRTWDAYDDSRICDNRAKSSAEALPASWIKADCASWIRAQGENTVFKSPPVGDGLIDHQFQIL